MAYFYRPHEIIIKDENYRFLDYGAYGMIFLDQPRKRVRKVYIAEHNFDHASQVFNAENDAYRIASRAEELANIVPEYFGIVSNFEVHSHDGNITSQFYTNLSFEMSYIECNFQKYLAIGEVERAKLRHKFQKHGINHIIDSGVCIKDGKVFKIIDFATSFVEPWGAPRIW